MPKLYFPHPDSETCIPLADLIADAVENETPFPIRAFEAVPERDDHGSRWCRVDGEFVFTGSCGAICSSYWPCNGRSGKCRHNGGLGYTHGRAVTVSAKGRVRYG